MAEENSNGGHPKFIIDKLEDNLKGLYDIKLYNSYTDIYSLFLPYRHKRE